MSMTLSLCCENLLGDKFWRSFDEKVIVNSFASFLEQQKFLRGKELILHRIFWYINVAAVPSFWVHQYGLLNYKDPNNLR